MVIDEFVVAIGANTNAFSSGIAGILKQLDGLEISAAKISGSLAGMAATGAVALVALTGKAINYQEAIYGASKATGVSAESLSVLAYAGRQSGISIEGLQTGLSRLAVKAGDAASGSKSATAEFAAFGISVKDAGGNVKSSDVLLREMSASMERTGGTTGRTSDVIALMGRGGSQYMELLGTNFNDAAKEAENFGVIVTDDAAASADTFKDAIQKIQEPLTGIGISIATRVVPAMLTFVNKIVDIEKSTSVFSDVAAGAVFAFKGLASAAIIVVTAFQQAGMAIGAVAAALSLVASGNFSGAMTALKSGFEDVGKKGLAANNVIRDMWAETKTASEESKKFTSVIINSSEHVKNAGGETKKLSSEKRSLTKEIKEASKEAEAYGQRMYDLARIAYPEATITAEEYGNAQADVAKKFLLGQESAEAYGQRMYDLARVAYPEATESAEQFGIRMAEESTKVRDKIAEDYGSAKGVGKTFLDLDNTWSQFKVSFSSAVSDIIISGGSLKEKLADIFDEIGKTLLRTIISAITETLVRWAAMKFIMGQPVTLGGVAGQVFGGMPGGGNGGMGGIGAVALGSTIAGNMGAGWAAGQAGGFGAAGQLVGNAPLSTTIGAYGGAIAPYAGGAMLGMGINQLINGGEDQTSALVGSLAGTFLGGPLGGAIGGALASPIADAGDFFANVFGWADGGIVTKPSLGWVAEAGQPEAIIPLDRLDEFVGGGGGGNGSQTIIINLDGRQIARSTAEHFPSVLRMHGVIN